MRDLNITHVQLNYKGSSDMIHFIYKTKYDSSVVVVKNMFGMVDFCMMAGSNGAEFVDKDVDIYEVLNEIKAAAKVAEVCAKM